MMSENKLAPYIKFFDAHHPTMETGKYTITAKGKISHSDIPDDTESAAKDLVQSFAVYGERYSFKDQDFRSVFPSPGSTGEYSAILPHVIFHRNTLPWERHAIDDDESIPWLALLMFDESQTPDKKVIHLKKLKSNPTGAGSYPILNDGEDEVVHHDDDLVTVIDVPKTVLEKILPSLKDLPLLCHSRQGVQSAAEDAPVVGEENAVVFCNRLPQQGTRTTMHLVSLEKRYTTGPDGFDYSNAGDLIRLVSMKSWEFYTLKHFKITNDTLTGLTTKNAPAADVEKISTLLNREFAGTNDSFIKEVEDDTGLQISNGGKAYESDLIDLSKFDKTFDGMLLNLNKDLLSFRLPKNKNISAEKYLSKGLVPLVHGFRDGEQSVSWYRSPFIPVKPLDDGSAVRNLKAETADELLLFDRSRGMFDTRYATAWEIGRLLALANKDFAVHLFQWKRLIAQGKHQARQLIGNEHLPIFAHSNQEREQSIWDNHLQLFLSDLASLKAVPANYLLPVEGLLPTASIRFFYIDRNWIIALLNGAFSIAGDWGADRQSEANSFTDFLKLEHQHTMGFILRSDVVEGWPGLLIDGIDADGKIHDPLRRKLSKNILLCTYPAIIKQVAFHQKPEVLHFGLTKTNESFSKMIRDKNGVEGTAVEIPWKDETAQVIDINALAKALQKEGLPAEFGMNMIEGIPKVFFTIE